MLARDKWGEMQSWIDAYSVNLEANARAATNPIMRKRIEENLRDLKAQIAITADEAKLREIRSVLANQEEIYSTLQRFNIEAYREIEARWRSVLADLQTSGWDLREEVFFEGQPNGNVNAWQGKKNKSRHMIWGPASAQVAVAFLNWVGTIQDQVSDPLEYTKTMLEKQGITAENFDQHADKMLIANPWATKTKIIVPPAGTFGG